MRLIGLVLLYWSWSAEAITQAPLHLEPLWVRPATLDPVEGFQPWHKVSPILFENEVWVPNAKDGLKVFDRNSGDELWRLPLEGGASGATHEEDLLYVGTQTGAFHCINLKTRTVVWTHRLGTRVAANPLVENGSVFVPISGDAVVALQSDGTLAWRYARQTPPSELTVAGAATPALIDGSLLVGWSDGFITWLNPQSGAVLQEFELDVGVESRFRDIDGAIRKIPGFEKVAVPSVGLGLFLFEWPSFEPSFRFDEDGGVATQPLFLNQWVIYSASQHVIARDIRSGDLVWRSEKFNSFYLTQPLLYEKWVITGESSGDLVFLDLIDGHTVARFEPGRGLMSAPVVQGNQLFLISNDANAFALKIRKSTSRGDR